MYLHSTFTCARYVISLQLEAGGSVYGEGCGARAGNDVNLRIDAALKAEFTAVVEAEDRPAAEVLRGLMRGYVRIAAPPVCRRSPPSIEADCRVGG